MKVTIEFNNQEKSPVRKPMIQKIAQQVLAREEFNLKNKTVEISVVTLSLEEIKKINKTYRRKNEPTDILSFAEYKNQKALEKEKSKEIFLGELILCYNDIKNYCQKEKLNLKKEIANVLAHGVLHLLGLKHGKRMYSIQKEITKNIK